jgi:hypothetical protein
MESSRPHEEEPAEVISEVSDSEPLVAFVHIPKTAGGTATSMLNALYSKQEVRKTGNYLRGGPGKTERKIAASLRKGGRVFIGHTPYGAFRDRLPRDTRYMTFLREPVDRVLSHYYRHIHVEDPRRAGRVRKRPSQGWAAKAESLKEALVELRLPQINNLATRFLCGHRTPIGDLPASAVDDAKQNLREFAFVGIQERFDESLVLLQRTLGLGVAPYRDRHVSSDRPAVDEITKDERALIEEYNQLDAELYRFGLGLFEDAVGAAANEGFAADVEALRASSADANEEAIQNARDWLDRELPLGTTRLAVELRLAAKAAGIAVPALTQALQVASVKKEPRDGRKAFTRVSEPQ